MSENINPFQISGSETKVESASSIVPPPPAPTNQAGQVAGELNVQHIDTRRITGPLVVFFGPREIGKTVTLLRLCTFLRSSYQISPDPSFRADGRYANTVAAFEGMLQNMQFAPGATGIIDFLLLNVMRNGERFCQFLEAPGEHFFERTKTNAPYPNYMNKILADNYQKIFVFFFELDMFGSDEDLRNYSDRIARLVSDKISSRRDHVVILCNKSDLQGYFHGGMPIESEYKKALYNHPSFRRLKETLRSSGFQRVPFVVFSSGAFNDDGSGQFAFAPSPEHYPKRLWNQIHESIHGRPWWKIW